MSLKRREFFKVAALSSTALATNNAFASDDTVILDCDATYGVLVDTVVCIGCRKCEWACNQQHGLSNEPLASFDDKTVFQQHRRPHSRAYTVVNEYRDPAKPDKAYTLKVQCMHCNAPACVSACIVGAIEKSPHGPVVYDAAKCIGCRYCMVACPFQIPAYEYDNALDPQVRKCTFCSERHLEEGGRPACVEICPNEALTFGTRQDLIALGHAKIRTYSNRYTNYVYGENEAGGTSWMYLAATEFNNTELPELPPDPMPEKTETIQHGIFKSFIPPLALYGFLGLVMHSLRNNKNEEQEAE